MDCLFCSPQNRKPNEGGSRPISWCPFRESLALEVTHKGLGMEWDPEMLGRTPGVSVRPAYCFLSVQGCFPPLTERWEPEVHRPPVLGMPAPRILL